MKKPAILLAVLLALPVIAQAHTGAGPAHGFEHGLQHPLFGLDHLLAMVAVGLWAAQIGGRAIWVLPLAFVGTMAVGGILGMTGVSLPLIEPGITTSVLLLGLLIAFAVRLPLAAAAPMVALFAIFHGHAHGAEMPATTSGLAYATGFLLATTALHGTGVGLGIGIQHVTKTSELTQAAGAAIALAGFGLFFV